MERTEKMTRHSNRAKFSALVLALSALVVCQAASAKGTEGDKLSPRRQP